MLMKYISPSMSRRRAVSTTIYHVLMLLVSFLMLYPVLWLIASSFKPNGDIFTTATSLIPAQSTLEHYIKGWQGFGGYTFTVFFKNSLFVAILSAIGMTISSALVAFGLARIRFKGRNVWFVLMIITMMLPGQVMMIPRFVLFNKMGWVGSYLPMIVPSFFASGFNIFLIMQFIRGIPRDMDEAAKIDGCSWYGVFFRIIVPLSRPIIATVAVFCFIGVWNDYVWPSMVLPQEFQPIQSALNGFQSRDLPTGAKMASLVVTSFPIFVLYVVAQKYIVKGFGAGGLKL